jgi:WD40 repeat protein
LDEGRELLLWRKGVEDARVVWEKAAPDQKQGFLLSGARVAEARRWLSSHAEDLQPAERKFLAASVVADDERITRERAEQEERLRLSRNRAVAAIAAAVLAVIAVAVAGLAIKADQDRQAEADRHRTTRLAKTRLLQDASLDRERRGDHGTSAVLLGHALVEAAGHDRDLESALRVSITLAHGRLLPLRNILKVTGLARGCAVSPDGKLAVVETDKGRVWYVDLLRSQLVSTPAGAGEVFYKTGDDEKNDSVAAVAFDPVNPRYFVAATDGGTIHVVDTTTGQARRRISHPGQPLAVSFSPDGRSIVVAGRRGDTKRHPNPVVMAIYELESGTCSQAFPLDYELYAAAFSPDGRWIAAGGGIPPHPRLAVWDLNAPRASPRILPQPARVFTLAFRPRHVSKLVTGDVNGGVCFWDLAKKAGEESDGPQIRHDKQVRVTTFSDDGRLLLVGGEDGSARVWDVETRLQVGQRLEHLGEVRAGAVKAGRVVTADFAGDIRVWDLPPGERAERVFPHGSPVWDVTFNDKGDRVLTRCASSIDAPGSERVWDLAGGAPVQLKHGADVIVARFRPNAPGEAVTCGNDGSVLFWDIQMGQKIGTPLSHDGQLVYTAAFDSTGNRFAFAGLGDVISFCDFDPVANMFRERQRVNHPVSRFVWNIRFGPDNKHFYSDGGQCVRVRMLGTGGKLLDLCPPTEKNRIDEKVEVRLGAIDGGGGRVLTLGMDGGAAIWSLTDPTAPSCSLGNKPHGSGQLCADWHSKRDVIATGGPDGVVCLWRPDGTRWSTHDLRHPSSVEVLTFSPDGRWLATGCRDGGVRLWSVDGGVWTGAGWYHAGPVTRILFSSNGQNLLSASRDGTARLVPIAGPTVGTPDAILAGMEADAGILVAVGVTGTTSSVAAPQPLTAETFRSRRDSAVAAWRLSN